MTPIEYVCFDPETTISLINLGIKALHFLDNTSKRTQQDLSIPSVINIKLIILHWVQIK